MYWHILQKLKDKVRRDLPQTPPAKKPIIAEDAALKKMRNSLRHLVLAKENGSPRQCRDQQDLQHLMLMHPEAKDSTKRHIMHHIAAAGLPVLLNTNAVLMFDAHRLTPLDYAAINGQITVVETMLAMHQARNCMVLSSGRADNSMSLSDVLKYRLHVLNKPYNENIDVKIFSKDVGSLIKKIDNLQRKYRVKCPTTLASQATLDDLSAFIQALNNKPLPAHYQHQTSHVCFNAPSAKAPPQAAIVPKKCAA